MGFGGLDGAGLDGRSSSECCGDAAWRGTHAAVVLIKEVCGQLGLMYLLVAVFPVEKTEVSCSKILSPG